jgi:hypothetical protein
MRIAIGSDHAGFALKEAIKVCLTAEHRDTLDPHIGRALRENRAERGISKRSGKRAVPVAIAIRATVSAASVRRRLLGRRGQRRVRNGPSRSIKLIQIKQHSLVPNRNHDEETWKYVSPYRITKGRASG